MKTIVTNTINGDVQVFETLELANAHIQSEITWFNSPNENKNGNGYDESDFIIDTVDYVEVYNVNDFEENKEDYSFFMAVDDNRFFLYNDDFYVISEIEKLPRRYDSNDDLFSGSPISDVEFIESFLN